MRLASITSSALCGLLLLTAALVAPVAGGRAVPVEPAIDRSLLRKAVKVHSNIDFGWCCWLTDHELLLGRGSKATQYVFSRKDLRTGKERPLRLLTSTYYQWNHNHTTLSPDGRFALWRSLDYTIRVVALDGSDYDQEWQDPLDEHDDLVWMPDSRHWMILNQWKHSDGARLEVKNFDLRAPKRTRTLRTNLPAGSIELVTPRRTALAYDCDMEEMAWATAVTIIETGLSPDAHSDHRYRIPIPAGKQLSHLAFSPAGDRIAWTFQEPAQRRVSVWVSDLRGATWHRVGALFLGAQDKNSAEEIAAEWVPGGKALTFVWDDACWKVPAP